MKTLLIILVIGYQKENKKSASSNESILYDKNPNSQVSVGAAGGTSGEKNYCESCGTSTYPNHGCNVDPTLLSEDLVCRENYLGSCSVNSLNTEPTDASHELISTVIPYQIRDSFLINFPKGSRYITYYNLIGQVVNDKSAINPGNLIAHYNLAVKFSTTGYTLMYGANGDVPIDSSFVTDAKAMITYL